MSTSASADRIYFMLGAMDVPANYKPTLHAYVREQLPFVHMPDGLPRSSQDQRAETDGDDIMKLTLSWLKDHLETDASLAEIVERLTSIGLEVESVDDKSGAEALRHRPRADGRAASGRRQAARADRRYRRRRPPVQVVCGAPNARAGLVGAFAAPGTYIPGIDVTLAVGNDPRRRKPRHDAVGARAGAVRRA